MPKFSLSHSNYHLAWIDLVDALKSWRIWLLLAWHEVKLRYRRSTLGPFWITLSMAITIYTMGVLYGHLFKMDLAVYYPFLATGILGWNLISLIVNDATMTFVNVEQFIKQMKQPYLFFLFQSVTRNFIIFFHNILVLVPLILFFHLKKLFADFHKVEQVVLKIIHKAIKPFKMMEMTISIAKFSFPCMSLQ